MSELSKTKHTEEGLELMDPTPMQPPVGYKKTPTLTEQIAQQVRRMKMEILADENSSETDEEADDFVTGDEDFTPTSRHEWPDSMPTIQELKKQAKEINDQIAEANRKRAIELHEKALKKPVSVTTPPAQPVAPVNTKTDSE